jgi:hypothetical protein
VRHNSFTDVVFYNVRGKISKAAAALDGECRYLSAVGKGAAGPAMLECAGTTCLQCRNIGTWYWYDNTSEFSKALLQNINNNQPGGTWGFAKMEVYQTTYMGYLTTGAVWIDSNHKQLLDSRGGFELTKRNLDRKRKTGEGTCACSIVYCCMLYL